MGKGRNRRVRRRERAWCAGESHLVRERSPCGGVLIGPFVSFRHARLPKGHDLLRCHSSPPAAILQRRRQGAYSDPAGGTAWIKTRSAGHHTTMTTARPALLPTSRRLPAGAATVTDIASRGCATVPSWGERTGSGHETTRGDQPRLRQPRALPTR